MIDQISLIGLAMLVMFLGCICAIASKDFMLQIAAVILTIAVLALIPLNCHAVSFQRAKVLFSHLQNVSGHHVKLVLLRDKEINAYSVSPYVILVTQGLLDFCCDSEIVAVLGHELGHVANQDYRRPEGAVKEEVSADLVGDYYCRKLGYSNRQCLKFMRHIRKIGGEMGDDVHPTWSKRIKNLERAR
jgi:hypothetical protein